DECQAWLRKYAPDIIKKHPHASTRAVEMKAREFMQHKGVSDAFFLESVPLPGS
ncbi:hypothetical protein FRC11_010934, partial [Ceratobasidium sp. 423]